MGPDAALLIWINQTWADPGLDFLFAWVSARAGFSWPLLLLLLVLFRHWFAADGVRLWLLLVACVVVGDLLGNLLKQLFAMPRPCYDLYELLRPPGGGDPRQCDAPLTGMPSSHALNFFAVASFLAYALRRLSLTLLFYLIALLVGLSRIYLGKHYPSQVLAGAAIGLVYGLLFAWAGLNSFAFGKRLLAIARKGEGGDPRPPWALTQRLLRLDGGPNQRASGLGPEFTWLPLLLVLSAAVLIWWGDWNRPLFIWLNQLGSVTGYSLWSNLTLLGDTLVAFGLLSLLARHRPDMVAAVFIAAGFALLWVHGLKPLLDLPRPLAVLGADQVHVIGQSLRNHSFPSGHTTTAFLLAGVIVLRGVHPALALGLFILALVVGFSRAVVGAHWPLDILAGMFGGWLSASLGVWLARRWSRTPPPGLKWLMWFFFAACGAALLVVRGLGYPQALPLQMLVGLACLGYSIYCMLKLRTQG